MLDDENVDVRVHEIVGDNVIVVVVVNVSEPDSVTDGDIVSVSEKDDVTEGESVNVLLNENEKVDVCEKDFVIVTVGESVSDEDRDSDGVRELVCVHV